MIIDPLKIVLFPGGCSGNFIGDWLTLNESSMRDPQFQIDMIGAKDTPTTFIKFDSEWWSNPRFKLGMINDLSLLSEQEIAALEKNIDKISYRETDVFISHITDQIRLSKIIPNPAHYVTIWPINNRFGWIKNTYHKNNVIDTSKHSDKICYFSHLYNFIEYFDLTFDQYHCRTFSSNQIFDFDKMQDINALTDLFRRMNSCEPSKNKIEWANAYISKQLKSLNPISFRKFDSLKYEIDPVDLFDVAVLLYVYEKHNKTNLTRMWSIDEIPDAPMEALDFITKNHMNYIP